MVSLVYLYSEDCTIEVKTFKKPLPSKKNKQTKTKNKPEYIFIN